MASCMEMCEDMRKPAKQSFSLLSHPSPCFLTFSHSDNYLPETHTSFQETPTHTFVSIDLLLTYQVLCVMVPVTPFFPVRSQLHALQLKLFVIFFKYVTTANSKGLLYLRKWQI